MRESNLVLLTGITLVNSTIKKCRKNYIINAVTAGMFVVSWDWKGYAFMAETVRHSWARGVKVS